MNVIIPVVIVIVVVIVLYVFENKQGINNISISDLKQQLVDNKELILVDVRTEQEFKDGHIAGAVSAPLDAIETSIVKIVPDKAAYFIVYCHSGRRSTAAFGILKKKGYSNFKNFRGSIIEWVNKGNSLKK